MRPVVSMPGSPYDKIAQQVAKGLSIVPECQINCKTRDIWNNLKIINLKVIPKISS